MATQRVSDSRTVSPTSTTPLCHAHKLYNHGPSHPTRYGLSSYRPRRKARKGRTRAKGGGEGEQLAGAGRGDNLGMAQLVVLGVVGQAIAVRGPTVPGAGIGTVIIYLGQLNVGVQ